MKLENLHVGMAIKNYGELCRLLGVEQKKGGSKKFQIKELERYFRFHTEGQKIVVDEVYSVVAKKIDKRKMVSPNAKYVNELSIAIMDYLASRVDGEQEANHEFMTSLDLFEKTGMVNEQYRPLIHNIGQLESLLKSSNIEEDDISDFLERATKKMREILKSTLRSLERRSLIAFRVCHLLVNRTKIDNVEVVTSKRVTTEDEETIIREMKREIAREMGFNVDDIDGSIEGRVYSSMRSKEFNSRLNRRIRKHFHCNSVYTGWKIDFHKNIVGTVAHYKQKQEELDRAVALLNRNVDEAIDEQARSIYEENLREAEKQLEEVWGESSKMTTKKYQKLKENWLENQFLCTDFFIKPL